MLISRSRRASRAHLITEIELSSNIHSQSKDNLGYKPPFSVTTTILDSKYGNWIRQTGSKSGLWEKADLERFVVKKIRLTIGAVIATFFLINFFSLPTLFLFIAPLFAFFFPDLRLIDKARERVAEITRALPDTIDLLNMCVSAGIGFHSGMQRVAATQDNPLSQEFSRVLSEMRLGQGRGPALLSLSERLQIKPLEQFVNSILQVDRLGVPMNRVLEEQSRRLRAMRREKAREQAQKLPVKILAPTLIFMMPALLIIVLGPAVISIFRSFG